MKFQVKNLGPIKNASIDLSRKLTIFCGANNTGKTYLNYLVYAIITRTPQRIDGDGAKSKIKNGSFLISIEELNKMPQRITETIKSDLGTIWGIGEESLESLFSGFELSIESKDESKIKKIGFKGVISNLFLIKKEVNSLAVSSDFLKNNPFPESVLESLLSLSYTGIYHKLILDPIATATILPAERNSIYTFTKELSLSRNELIERLLEQPNKKNIDIQRILQNESKRYPLAITDSLRVANDLETIKKTKSEYFALAEEIENGLLGGSIGVSKDGQVQFTSNKTDQGKTLPIHITSSLIKSLSSLVVYLKYKAKTNDLIIIDEPEMNLHPDNQVLLVKIFGKLLNKGLRLLISTHSDYIIREINNLILASSEKEGVRETALKLGYDDDIVIRQNDVGAYYFYSPKDSETVEVKELEVKENGVAVESIDATITEQNNVAEELLGTILYGNDE